MRINPIFAALTLIAAFVQPVNARQSASPPPPDAAAEQAARDASRARHKAAMDRLAPLIGEWTAAGTYGQANERGEFAAQHGAWSNRWLYDGAHLECNFDVVVDGRRRQYRGIMSYNLARERYETVWLGDTGYRFAESGSFDAAGKVLTLTSMQDRPGTEALTKVVSVFTFAGPDTIIVEDTSHDPATGKGARSFYVELTRVK